MNIEESKILVLGGWGLVGAAICHKLMEYNPGCLVVSSLKQSEAEDAVQMLRNEYPDKNPEMFQLVGATFSPVLIGKILISKKSWAFRKDAKLI